MFYKLNLNTINLMVCTNNDFCGLNYWIPILYVLDEAKD